MYEACWMCGHRFEPNEPIWYHAVPKSKANKNGDYGGGICRTCCHAVNGDPERVKIDQINIRYQQLRW